MTLTVGSLFSGIGGLDLGLERAGMRVVWQAEVDPYASRVLARHWPNVPNLGDVTTIDWSTVDRPDLICGGYPCQPFSLAGRRRGANDPRHLWPHFADALRALRPRWALLENVAAHLVLGFGDVLADLAEIGYDAEWDCVPAAAVGAPHIRDRVFVVAYPSRGSGQDGALSDARLSIGSVSGPSRRVAGGAASSRSPRQSRDAAVVEAHVGDPDQAGRTILPWRETGAELARRRAPGGAGGWRPEPDVGRVADGLSRRLDIPRLRGLGNAVVPQVAEVIGRMILRAEDRTEGAA